VQIAVFSCSRNRLVYCGLLLIIPRLLDSRFPIFPIFERRRFDTIYSGLLSSLGGGVDGVARLCRMLDNCSICFRESFRKETPRHRSRFDVDEECYFHLLFYLPAATNSRF
jgi:hypothetical protein